MYILEIRNRESQRVVSRTFSRWLWLHNLRVKRTNPSGLYYVKCYVLNEVQK